MREGLRRTRPSLNLLAIAGIFVMSLAGYLAIIWSGEIRGFSPDKTVALRDLALFVPIFGLLLWLVRRQRFRGEMLLLTAAVFLFAIGSLTQFRMFSDPEYGARGADRTRAREMKAQTVRLLNIETGYGDDKKQFMFGDGKLNPPAGTAPVSRDYTVIDMVTSVYTFIPILAVMAAAVSFLLFKSDGVLEWLQRHSLIIGLATLFPFMVVVLLFSQEGKFLGRTTPWEGVKILFLVSFAGMLAETYRHLSRTYWGAPPARYLFPFLLIAAMPVIPFFVLADFGQMLVFFGVYLMLYVVAVRRKAQLAYASILVAIVFAIFLLGSTATGGFGLPERVHFRFYQWINTWTPPPADTWWWRNDLERYFRARNTTFDAVDARELNQINREAWADKVLQQSQGIFGVHEGGVLGRGLGLGFPETVPISDSDFIYAAIAEETGLAGSLAILMALMAIVLAGTAVSLEAPDMFTKLMAAGLTAFVGFQALVNIGGVLRFLPMTGITLPFVSHGGWSLITSFAMMGILLALSHRNSLAASFISTAPASPITKMKSGTTFNIK